MTFEPRFEELVDADELDARERQHLARVHELLVAAGPPPELSPELAAGPNMFKTRRAEQTGRGTWFRNRAALLAAAALIAIAAFVAGSHTGEGGFDATRSVPLQPTAAASTATARIEIGREHNENWPMRIVATGLADSKANEFYAVLLTRGGKVVGPCGWFVVHGGRVVAMLNAPYKLRGAGWIVTRQHQGSRTLGPVVLRTTV
jgi:hypothetical protein